MKERLLRRGYLMTLFMVLGLSSVWAQEGIDSGTTAWMLTSTALVLLMVPGTCHVLWRPGEYQKCIGDDDA